MRRSEILVSMTLLWVVTTPRAIGQFLQQGAKLVGDGGISATDQGAAVAVSADGNTAVVGGPDDNDAIGAVWVFTRTGGAWNQQGGKLVGNGGANDSFGLLQQGTSVAISADGNTIISGAPYDNNDMGAVWVFNRSNGVWSQQGMKLVGTGGSAESKQGTSVALSADGNMAIVGGTGDNSVWTFIRVNGTWSQRGSKLSESFDCFGSAAALSADGNTALVGSFCEGTVGAAWVFTQSGGGWIQDTKLVGSGAIGDAFEGLAVALSSDGNTALVGGYFDDNFVGAAWVFTRVNGIWSQQVVKLTPGGTTGGAPQFGQSVALSGDGNTAFVGGPADNNFAGATWIFTRTNGVWTGQSKLSGSSGAELGSAVAVSADGSTAIVGGTSYPAGAWVFSKALVQDQSFGVFRNGGWFVDWNGNDQWDATDAAHIFYFGLTGDLPVIGDWSGDGRLKPGVYRSGVWFVDWNGNNQWDATDAAHVFYFGLTGDLPVMGDWNGDGHLKAGVYRNGVWYVDWNGNNQWDSTDAAHLVIFGLPGDLPVMGDWNGDGSLKVGVYRNGAWFVDWNGNNQWDAEDAAHIIYFGLPGDLPVMGDWNGDGRLKIGIYRNGAWYVDWNGNYQWDSVDAAHVSFFGLPGDRPVIGQWNASPQSSPNAAALVSSLQLVPDAATDQSPQRFDLTRYLAAWQSTLSLLDNNAELKATVEQMERDQNAIMQGPEFQRRQLDMQRDVTEIESRPEVQLELLRMRTGMEQIRRQPRPR